MPLPIRTDSTELVTDTVTADHDITGCHVDIAVPPSGVAPTTWYPADVLSVTQVGVRWVATFRILVGPTGGVTQLAPGSYDFTVRVTDNHGPEVIVRKTGTLQITLI